MDGKADTPQAIEARSVNEAKEATSAISSKILDMVDIQSKVTEPGPGPTICEDLDPEFQEYYRINHPWSIYGASNEALSEGMQNLREELPKNGWEITKDGPANSKDKDPEILAENREKKHVIHITWHRESTSKEPLIHVNVTSSCFKVPEGQEIR